MGTYEHKRLHHVNQHHALPSLLKPLKLPLYSIASSASFMKSGNNNNNTNASKYNSRYFNRKFKTVLPFLLLVLCIYRTMKVYLTTELNQSLLEMHTLTQHKQSDFNPKSIALDVFNYLIEQQHSLDSRVGTSDGVYFHWDDWVDLSRGDKFLHSARLNSPSGTHCDPKIIEYGSVSGHWLESYKTKVQRGAVNLYCSKDIPEKLIVFTDREMVEIPVIGKRRFGNDKTRPVNSDQLMTKMAQINTSSTEHFKFKFKSTTNLQKQIMIEPEDFIFKPDVEIFALQEKLNNQTITSKELKYLEFLEYSNNHLVDHTDRYFKYAWIYTDVIQGNAHHIAYPFFNRYISDRERQSVLHHMVRVWFQFAEANGFASWINYGSLLGWSFNGVNMPWDTDIDVQMPIAQLDRLGREFNKTLIMENPRFGNARYWLEISPTYIRQGNGRNHIDARFIDIQSGLYIDISALSHTEVPPPTKDSVPDNLSTMLVHCKNWNWHTLDELLPIRHTYFEGASVYIPNKVNRLLTNKYGATALTNYNFHNHNFQSDISIWVSDRICKKPPGDSESRFNRWHELTQRGSCNSRKLKDEYNIVKKSTQRHSDLNQNLDYPMFYDIELVGDLPVMRKDSWDYYYDINNRVVDNYDWYVYKEIIQ
ncbi:uncharacterized protein LODBEIA_P02240 [Lodderomyces beijingensis]|uniref:LicD/FKTN/FKRP nucleotidyltransferase domain-containing protein n=1 Tax=Lodderomyces beijingensis TaxID=1775926 RepID=A0ABP0ZI34_9ASCO